MWHHKRKKALLAERARLNDELRRLKTQFTCARAEGTIPAPIEFLQLNNRVNLLQMRSQQLQHDLGELRAQMKGESKPRQEQTCADGGAFQRQRRNRRALSGGAAPAGRASRKKTWTVIKPKMVGKWLDHPTN
jgi:hypothetical protein